MATDYVVLARTGEAKTWHELTDEPVAALGDTQAIQRATDGMTAEEKKGTFVAVPARSFKPRTREIEVKEIDRWS
jgi:hypothetical protein